MLAQAKRTFETLAAPWPEDAFEAFADPAPDQWPGIAWLSGRPSL